MIEQIIFAHDLVFLSSAFFDFFRGIEGFPFAFYEKGNILCWSVGSFWMVNVCVGCVYLELLIARCERPLESRCALSLLHRVVSIVIAKLSSSWWWIESRGPAFDFACILETLQAASHDALSEDFDMVYCYLLIMVFFQAPFSPLFWEIRWLAIHRVCYELMFTVVPFFDSSAVKLSPLHW